LVINFWATWCPPCLREMPALGRFQREFANQSWQVVGLAVDQEQPVLAYLAKNPAGYPIALAGLEGVNLSRAWGNSSGGLPFTVVLDKIGRVAHTHLGEASYAQMASWASAR
jgi:thiol-disulfide isomerase/thioredoxin